MKSIILDLDGTILESDNSLSTATVGCIKEISKNNIVVIATGRSLVGLPPSVLQIKNYISYYITSNGTSIFDMQFNKIYEDTIKANAIKVFLETILSKKELVVEILSNGIWHIDTCGLKRFSSVNLKPQILEYIKKTRNKHDDFRQFLFENDIDIEKISINLCSPVATKTIDDIHLLCNQNGLRLFSDNPHKIDVFKSGTNKSTALSFLCKHSELKLEQTAVFGNDENDIEIFNVCAQSVCMANSPAYLKRIANIVLRKNDNKRIARGIHILKRRGFLS